MLASELKDIADKRNGSASGTVQLLYMDLMNEAKKAAKDGRYMIEYNTDRSGMNDKDVDHLLALFEKDGFTARRDSVYRQIIQIIWK